LLFVSSAAISKGSGPPNGLNVTELTVYRFAGYSTSATDGDAGGLPGMHALCQESFGPDALMCTTEQFFQSPGIATSPPEPVVAWIQPKIIESFQTSTENATCLDYSTAQMSCRSNDNTCNQWAFRSNPGSPRGLTFESLSGGVSTEACDAELVVVCCLPASQ
jgi:hypothetical protein